VTGRPPVRLAVTVVSHARDIWGSERSVLNAAPELHRLGIDLTIAAPDGDFAAAAADLGLVHRRLVLPGRGGERTAPLHDLARDALGVPAGIARIARATSGADVVHSNNLLVHPDTALAGRLTRRPTVLELHDIVAPGVPALLQSAAAALSSAVVSISRATSAPVRGPGRHRLHLVPQAIDVDRFGPGPGDPALRRTVGDPPLVVGIVGRVDPSKGVDVAIEAVAAAGADLGLLVVGAPGWDAGDHLVDVLALGQARLGDRFHHAGLVSDVPTVLRSVDILVNASDAEPFGLSVLEAQAVGVPVVGTAAGGIPDFVEDGVTGLLVPPRDPAALARALRRLADDPALRARLASAAAVEVRARHGITARARTLADLYRAVARPRRG
jgi:glycosyltransferase involved in cell wall biosynthesis